MISGRRVLALGAAAMGLASCTQATQLLVTVKTADGLGVRAAVAQVWDDDSTRSAGPRIFEIARGGSSSFAVVPQDGDASRRVHVVVTGCSNVPDTAGACVVVATQSFHASFVAGQIVRIEVELSEACHCVECGLDHVCRAGACMPIRRSDGGADARRADCGSADAGADAATDGGAGVDAATDGGATLPSALTVSDAVANDELGYSVALSADGTVALVGAPSANAAAGSARVFQRTDTTWAERAPLASGGAAGRPVRFLCRAERRREPSARGRELRRHRGHRQRRERDGLSPSVG